MLTLRFLTAVLALCAALTSPRSLTASPDAGPRRASAEAPEPRRPPPDPPPEPTARDHLSVLLVGDSLMATALGQQIEVFCSSIPEVRCHRVARSATGLARPDKHDWPAVVTRAVKRHSPDFSVVLIGSNDGQDLRHRRPRPRRLRPVHWGDRGWPKAYRSRVDELLRALGTPRRRVLWLGLPPMRSRSLEAKLAVIRREQRAAVAALGPAGQYVGLFPFVRELRSKAPASARQEPYAADGVHFTLRGAIRFRKLLEPLLWTWILRAKIARAFPPSFPR